MGQMTRHHYGPARIDIRLIQEIEWATSMDIAAKRDVVVAERERLKAESYPYPWTEDRGGVVHDWWEILEVDAIQRLRGWHRLRYGTAAVRAEHLSAVRNFLDALLIDAYGEHCEDLLEEIGDDPYCADEAASVRAAIEQGVGCHCCENCRIHDLRDRCDDALDANGYDGGVYYRVYHLGQSVEQANREVYGRAS